MDELLSQLTAKIKTLIQDYERLKQANWQLSQENNTLLKENDLLQAKQKVAAAQIESMVSHLKSIENAQ